MKALLTRLRHWLGGRAGWRLFLRHLLVLGVVAAIGGACVYAFGLYDVSARAGHWPLTRLVLHGSYRNAVRWRAPRTPPPDLSDPAWIRLGAVHYERGCSACHGRPGVSHAAIPRAMEPRPPHVSRVAGDWGPNELAWIVREGVKMTGMPHWPARSRPDEVWPVVAFLLRAPTMDGREYRALVQGASPAPPVAAADGEDAPRVDPRLAACSGCHGLDGRPNAPGFTPRLDAQSAGHMREALHAYAHGRRDSGFMSVQVMDMPADAFAGLARHYAAQPPLAIDMPVDPRLLARGRAVAEGDDGRNPRCLGCHRLDPSRRNRAYPTLAGEHPRYLERQLRLFAAGTRGGGPHAHLMARVSHRLGEADMRAVAHWYAAQQRR